MAAAVTGDEVVFGVDIAGGDVAVVVMHRPAGGCWQVESAQGPAEDIAALVAAAWVSPPKLPVRQPGQALADLVAEWTRERTRENFDLGPEQLDTLRRMYARQMTTGTLVHVSTAAADQFRP